MPPNGLIRPSQRGQVRNQSVVSRQPAAVLNPNRRQTTAYAPEPAEGGHDSTPCVRMACRRSRLPLRLSQSRRRKQSQRQPPLPSAGESVGAKASTSGASIPTTSNRRTRLHGVRDSRESHSFTQRGSGRRFRRRRVRRESRPGVRRATPSACAPSRGWRPADCPRRRDASADAMGG